MSLTLSEAKVRVQGLHTEALTALDNGYSGRWVTSTYAGVPQRWLLLKSEQATHREPDAKQALDEFMSSLTLLRLEGMTCEACPVYVVRGSPSADQMPSHIEYQKPC